MTVLPINDLNPHSIINADHLKRRYSTDIFPLFWRRNVLINRTKITLINDWKWLYISHLGFVKIFKLIFRNAFRT